MTPDNNQPCNRHHLGQVRWRYVFAAAFIFAASMMVAGAWIWETIR